MKHPNRRWYDDAENPQFKQHIATDPWRLWIVDKLDRLARDLLTRWLIMAVAFVAVGVLSWVAFGRTQTEAGYARTDRIALCRFRDNLSDQVKSTTGYLATHPNGILGISAKQIERSLAQEAATLKALDPLNCQGIEHPKGVKR